MNLTPMHVSYNQIAAFRSALANPFNDWTNAHVDQGFAWRPGSVSFATIDSGMIEIEVTRSPPSLATSAAARIIVVPFEVDASGDVEVATIADSRHLHLKPGNYRLSFEHGFAPGGLWARFSFEPVADGEVVTASVVRADEGLKPSAPLLMEADPAVP